MFRFFLSFGALDGTGFESLRMVDSWHRQRYYLACRTTSDRSRRRGARAYSGLLVGGFACGQRVTAMTKTE